MTPPTCGLGQAGNPWYNAAMNIVLLGARGCGKTTLGSQLAAAVHWPFVDLDDRVLQSFEQLTVTQVWQARGEAAWRAAEVTALRDVLKEHAAAIIALGGGVPMIDAAYAMLKSEQQLGRAWCVYLRCTAEELASRLAHAAGDRPSLIGKSPADEAGEILAAREQTYEHLADVAVDVSSRTSQQAFDALLGAVRPKLATLED